MNPYVSDVTKFKKQVKRLGYSGNPLRENSMTKRYRNALKAAVKNSHNVQNLCLLGEALLGAGDMPGAVQVLKQAISESPDNTMGYNYLGKCMMKMKNYNIALSYFDSAINLNPKDPTSYNNRGLCKTMLK